MKYQLLKEKNFIKQEWVKNGNGYIEMCYKQIREVRVIHLEFYELDRVLK